jgi:hypothetical protein
LTNGHEGYNVIKLLLLVLMFGALIQAQAPDAPPLNPGEPLVLALDGQGPAVATFTAQAGERVTLTAQASTDLDVTLEILGPDGRRAAFNDDHGTDAGGLAASDARIEALLLADAGVYSVRVNSFNGVTAGEVQVTLTVMLPPDADAREIRLARGQAVPITLELVTGDRLRVTLRDPRGLRDPLVRLYGPDGALVAVNDDHASADLTLNLFDARVDVTVSDGGEYRLELREFLGRGGLFQLDITVDSTE